jgi:cobalt-zinc-cadmium resistance protein CzcA
MLGPAATPMGDVSVPGQSTDSTPRAKPDTLTLFALTNAQDYIIRPLLRTVPGVADVNSWGGMLQRFEVLADPGKLAGYGLTLRDLETALARNNANFGGGYVEDRGDRLNIRGLGRVADTADIAQIVVTTRGATPIHLGDLARVTLGPELRYGAVTRDGIGEALSATVLMLKGSNGREVVGRVEAKLAEIARLLPPGIRVRPYYNQGEVVSRTTRTVFGTCSKAVCWSSRSCFCSSATHASLLTASVIPSRSWVPFSP